MTKSRGQSKKKTEDEDDDVESQEDAPKRKAAKKRKAPVGEKKPAAAKKVVAKPEAGHRPLSVGGIIIRNAKSDKPDWEKEAPWHRKNPAQSRFADHGTDRRTKD